MTKLRARNLRERAFEYSLNAIELFRQIQGLRDESARILGKQFLRSATSIGANIEEAQSAESCADFIHKYTIAQKEARESLYWLRLLEKITILPDNRIPDLLTETNETVSIITSIIVNTKQNNQQ